MLDANIEMNFNTNPLALVQIKFAALQFGSLHLCV